MEKLTYAEENWILDEFECSFHGPHGSEAGFSQKFSLIKHSIKAVGLCLRLGGCQSRANSMRHNSNVLKESIIDIF